MLHRGEKQNNNRKSTKALSILLIAGVVFFVFGSNPLVVGQTADELAQLKQAKQAKLLEINKKIAD